MPPAAPNACRGCSGRWAARPISAAASATSTPTHRSRSNTPSTASRWRPSASSTCSTGGWPRPSTWLAISTPSPTWRCGPGTARSPRARSTGPASSCRCRTTSTSSAGPTRSPPARRRSAGAWSTAPGAIRPTSCTSATTPRTSTPRPRTRSRRRRSSRRLLPAGDDDLHLLVALDEDRIAALGLFEQADFGEALEDLFPDDGQLQLGQAVADAAVDAEAEGEVGTRTLAVDDVIVGVLDHLVVAVARDVPHHHPLALVDLLAAELEVLARHPRHVRQRGLPADRLGDHRGDQLGVGAQLVVLVRMAVEGEDRAGD